MMNLLFSKKNIGRDWLVVFCVILFSAQVSAQADSLALVNASWKSTEIAPGVWWRSAQVTHNGLFGANQCINIVEISSAASTVKLRVAYSDSLEPTSGIALSKNAIAAINGSFFKMRGADPDYRADLSSVPRKEPAKLDHNRSIVYLRANDTLIAANAPAKDGIRKRHQQGAIAITDRTLDILLGNPSDLAWENQVVARDVLSTGPVMLLAGINQPIPDDAFCNDRHPRTALAKKANGTILLFVVDGRMAESAGMSIPELQNTLRWLNCRDAINLDGGGSTTMFINGQPDHGVVNHPSDNKKFDHAGEREVADAILLVPIHKP